MNTISLPAESWPGIPSMPYRRRRGAGTHRGTDDRALGAATDRLADQSAGRGAPAMAPRLRVRGEPATTAADVPRTR